MDDIQSYTQQNRRAWDEIAEVRHQVSFPQASFFAGGGSTLDPKVVEAAGDVSGKMLLHLQCSTGSETMSWSVLGALATGADISEKQIEIAQQTARGAGLSTRFIAADIYQLPHELTQASFDLVYTGGGVLVWLPELTAWAATIAAALRPGGRFILHEEHPIAMCLWVEKGVLTLTDNYFSRSQPIVDMGWAHFAGGEAAKETKYEFSWPLGDIITALAQAGLVIERLQEYPPNAEWRFGDRVEEMAGLPGEYLLIARK
jgi:SAM-dependent methyltransferase